MCFPVLSATGNSLATPHTGGMRYTVAVPRIPAAAITVEDALWFRRLAAAGIEATVRLTMQARTLPDADSANVIAEIRAIKQMNPGFSPYIAAFSPHFLTLFRETG